MALALVAGACSDTGAPSPLRPIRLLPNVALEGSVRANDTARYYFQGAADVPFTIAVTALRSTVALIVRDSSGQELVPRVLATTSAPEKVTGTTWLIERSTAARYDILLIGDGRFSLRVFEGTPEHAPAELVPGTTIDEAIDVPNDVDVFTFRGTPGDLFIFYVRGLDPSGGKQLEAQVVSLPMYPDNLFAVSYGNDPELETQFSRTFVVPDDKPITLRVSGSYVGQYQLLVRRIDRRPEVAAPVAVENHITLTERLDYVGDIDDFRITGTPGAMYNVFFRLANGHPAQVASAHFVPDDTSAIERVVRSMGSDTSWRDRSTGRVTLDASGRATVSVIPEGVTRGAYELYVYRVDPRPEQGKETLAPSDSVTQETIELPGDRDDYDIDLDAGDTLIVTFAAPLPSTVAVIEVTLLAPDGTIMARETAYDNVPILLRLRAGTSGRYRARVDNVFGVGREYLGTYTLATHRFSGAPESGSGRLAWDEEVVEALEPAGDEDHYELDVVPGEAFELFLATVDLGAGEWFIAELGKYPDAGGLAYLLPGDRQYAGSRRLLVREPGRYRVWVHAGVQGDVLTPRGRYRLTIRRLPMTPERVSAILAPGDVVTREWVDYPGDIDQFTVRGTPGGYVRATLAVRPPGGRVDMEVLDPPTLNVLTATSSVGYRPALGRLRIPPSGMLQLQLLEPQRAAPFTVVAPYTLAVPNIDARPEHSPAVIAIGDTIRTESLEDGLDLDEFAVTATAGSTLAVVIDTPDGVPRPGLYIEAIDPRTDTILGEVSCYQPSRFFGQSRTLDFTIPTTGSYIIRIRKLEEYDDGPWRYTFAVVRP
ncbi:MAG: hypothetical protein IT359_17140 [Gemmatimonadaceae bacterium]|nr:hypothetical protein [Gemmatimonadaceae bacterium]